MPAAAQKTVTPAFVLLFRRETAWVVNSLAIVWDDVGLINVSPPDPIVHKTLGKVQSHGTTMIFITSQISSRLWHPQLHQFNIPPRLQLVNVVLYQYLSHLRHLAFHLEPALIFLNRWVLTGFSWKTTSLISDLFGRYCYNMFISSPLWFLFKIVFKIGQF